MHSLAAMNQKLQLIRIAEIGRTLEKELRDWFEKEFGRADRWAEPDFYLILNLEEQLAGRLAILDRQVSVGGAMVRVGGIGGVATKPGFRHRGVASAMLARAAEFIKSDLRVEFGLLLCRHGVSPVYAKMGWAIVPGPTTFARAGVTARYPNDTMILPLAQKSWPSGPINMLGLPW
jgi:aminoglycoside 2'-N-acetyltransferase I